LTSKPGPDPGSQDPNSQQCDLTAHLKEKLKKLKRQMRQLRKIEIELKRQPDEQLSLTDPDARSMATSGRGTGIVGYNVQAVVDAKHHLIVAREVINTGHDRDQPSNMATQAREAMGTKRIKVVADRGYYSGPEIPIGTSNPQNCGTRVVLRNETQARQSPKPRVDWLPESGKDGHWIEVFRCPERLQATEPDGRGYALDVIVILLG
jgi:hypothetical protein